MQRVRRFGGLSLFGFLLACRLGAQSLRGVVVGADGTTPVSGVIVVIETAAGANAGRALSDGNGRFALPVPTGGPHRLRALRIGYQPTLRDIVIDSTGTTDVRVVLNPTMVSLPTLTVRTDDVCRGRGADGAVVAEVWEEARKALLASGLSAAQPLVAEWIEYERTLDTTARHVREQRVRSTRTATTHAFRSLPPADLAAHGYVVDTDDGTVFHAPDAEVLLSDSFAATHCFHVEPPTPDRPTLIGVGFRPAREQRRFADIEGVFWIDRESRELRSLEYRYTNLPPITERVRPGGTVEFLRLSSGSWLVSRWNIRMPQLVTLVPPTIRRRGITVRGSPLTVTAVRIVGGEVSRVERGDTLLYQAPGARLSVVVRGADRWASVADVRVSLDGSDYSLLTDAAGRGDLSPVLTGSYRLRALSPLMDSLGVAPEPVEVLLRADDSLSVPILLPSADALLGRLCGSRAVGAPGTHVRGVVVDSLGLPVDAAHVRLTWPQQIGIVADRVVWNERTIDTRSDSLGVWSVCDVPRDVSVQIRVTSGPLVGTSRIRLSDSTVFSSAHTALAASAVTEDVVTEGSLVVSVTDSASRPIVDATVVITPRGARATRARTDGAGHVSVVGLPVGPVQVEVRKVGHASGLVAASVGPGANTMPIVMGRAAVPQLSAVRVVGDRVINARHEEFAQRHRNGDATASIGEEEIARRNPVSTWQLLTRVPSLLVLDSAGSIYARSSRMSNIVCWPRVAIDGRVLVGIPDLSQLPAPHEIFGIEVFAGSASAPLKFGGEGEGRYCGIIAIWTK